jgi:predicted amidophosphoribosyltransferase
MQENISNNNDPENTKYISEPEEHCQKCKAPLYKDHRYSFCKSCFESFSIEKQAEIRKSYWIKKIFFVFSYILIIIPFFLLVRSTEISILIVFFGLLITGIGIILFLEKKYPQYVPDEET